MAEKAELRRAVGRWDLAALAVNGVIGTAIFGLPATAAQLTGAWSLLACALCAVVVLFFVLCFAEASSLFTTTGGPYVYVREAFGDTLALAAGWMTWLARVTAFAANSNLFASYLAFFVPSLGRGAGRAAILVGVTAGLTVLNVRGVRPGALLGDFLAAVKLIPMFAFVAVGLSAVRGELFDFSFHPSYRDFGAAVLLYVFAFTGFEFAAIPAGEAKSPKKHLPAAMLSALAVAAVLYTGIQSVCVGTLPGLVHSQTAMADAAALFVGPVGGAIIAVTALVSMLGNLSAMMLVAPRLTFALAGDRLLPGPLAAVHPRYRTPHVSILVYGALTLALALSGTFVGMVRISSLARVFPYALTFAGLPVLRRKCPVDENLFRLRGGWTIPVISLALCVWLLSQSTMQDLAAGAAALACGYALMWITARPGK